MIRKISVYAALIAVALFSAMACTGENEVLELVIRSSADTFPADGSTVVTFSAFEGRADVTSQCVFYEKESGKALESNFFTTASSGDYWFCAVYDGRRSDYVKVIAEPVVESRFVRNVCLMEFTDGSCSFCPDASRYIDRNILGKNDNVHLMAFHEKDEWKSEQFAVLFSKFDLAGTPAASVDMRGGLSLESGERDNLKAAVSSSSTDFPAHCGVAVSSTIDAQGTAEITVRLYSERSSDYYLAVYVVEDGIKGYQLDGSIGYDDYYHQFVVRRMLSATVYGDSMGRMAAEGEKSRQYTVSCSGDWNREKTYVYALAIDSEGFVNNMQVCLLDGGDTDYEYVE